MVSYPGIFNQLLNLGLLRCKLTAVISFCREPILRVTSVQYMFGRSFSCDYESQHPRPEGRVVPWLETANTVISDIYLFHLGDDTETDP